jgi:hypothetical protein
MVDGRDRAQPRREITRFGGGAGLIDRESLEIDRFAASRPPGAGKFRARRDLVFGVAARVSLRREDRWGKTSGAAGEGNEESLFDGEGVGRYLKPGARSPSRAGN